MPEFLTLALTAAMLSQGPAEAEKLFRTMEKNVGSAKTLSLKCKVDLEGSPIAVGADVVVHMSQTNKMRVKAAVSVKGVEEELLVVSDGKKVVVRESKKADATRETPADFNKRFLDLILLGAMGVGKDELVRPGTQPAAMDILLTNWKLAGKEKIGNQRDTVAIEYDLTVKTTKIGLQVKLWLDAKTSLPVQRVLRTSGGDGKEIRFVETFSEFTIDGVIDPQLFSLPK